MSKKNKPQKLHSQANSQNQESSQNQLIDHQQEVIGDNIENNAKQEPDNTNIPFQSFQKSFPIFNKKNRSKQFKSYAKFKSDTAFDYFKQFFTQISGLSLDNHQPQEIKYNNPPPMPQQNIFVCKVSPNTTLFIHIYQAHNNKCHIRVMNSSGYVYAYFVEIRTCRKFCKIYKILKKFNFIQQENQSISKKSQSKHLFIIYDQLGIDQNQLNYVTKIADFAQQFCYYCHNKNQINPHQTLSHNSQRKEKNNKQLKVYFLQQDNLFCFYSNIFTSDTQNPYKNIQKMIEVQNQIQNPSEFTLDSSGGSVDFILKSMLINYQKSSNFSNKNDMYLSFKQMIDKFGKISSKKKQLIYGNPDDHYPQKMNTCKQCVHCPFNKLRINKYLMEKQKNTSESSYFYDSENQQVKQKANSRKDKFQKAGQNKRHSKNVIHYKFSDDEEDLNIKVHKSKYRCEGCTATAKKDIPLCLQCFEDYHIKKDKIKKKNMKKSAHKALRKKRLQVQKQLNAQVKSQQNQQNLQRQEQYDDLVKSSKSENEKINPICIDSSKSQNGDHQEDFSIDQLFLAKDFLKLEYLNQLLEKINQQRNNFMDLFAKLYSDPISRKMALNIVEFVQLKLTDLILWEVSDSKH